MVAKAKPRHLRIAEGTEGKGKSSPDEPMPEVATEVPKPPYHLCKSAKNHWNKTAPAIHAIGLLTKADEASFAMYCEAHARWVNAKMMIKRKGLIIKTRNGYPVQSPYLGIANTAFDQMRKMMGEFGMTPSSRAGMTGPKKPGAGDGMDDFLNRGKK